MTAAARECGSCLLCCKLPYLAELNKPIDTWCKHAAPGRGCLIYAERPGSCRGFICGWLSGHVDDIWFPARCKMIIAQRVPKHSVAEQGMAVTVDPAFPNAWRREPYYVQLRAWAQTMCIEIRVGRRCIRLHADGAEEEVRYSPSDIEGPRSDEV